MEGGWGRACLRDALALTFALTFALTLTLTLALALTCLLDTPHVLLALGVIHR